MTTSIRQTVNLRDGMISQYLDERILVAYNVQKALEQDDVVFGNPLLVEVGNLQLCIEIVIGLLLGGKYKRWSLYSNASYT